jgi:pimeloyl-ACP methyl ester carboxylesterase
MSTASTTNGTTPAAGPGENVLRLQDVALRYRAAGAGPGVLCIQGAGVPGDGWRPQVRALAPHFRVITFDNRGIGGSPRGPHPLTIEAMAADALAIMDAEGIPRFHVIGHSMGGLIAQHVALTARPRVKSLSLLCTFATGSDATALSLRMLLLGLQSRIGTRRMRRNGMLRMIMPEPYLRGSDRERLAEDLGELFGRAIVSRAPGRPLTSALLLIDRQQFASIITDATGASTDSGCAAWSTPLPRLCGRVLNWNGVTRKETRMRRFCPVLLVLLIPASAQAHFHKANAYAGISIASGSTLVGVHGTVDFPVEIGARRQAPDQPQLKDFSVVADFSTHWGSDDASQLNVMSGLRYTFARDIQQRTLPFAQLLLGGSRASRAGASDTDLALAIGAGVEHMFSSDDAAWGVRVQLDYIVRSDSGPRFSVGLVKRIPQ